VQADCAVEIDGNAYSVPWRLIGEMVRATIMDSVVRIHHGNQQVALHTACAGRRQRAVDPAHFEGLAGSRPSYTRSGDLTSSAVHLPPALLRSLGDYEALLGGGF
jgi:Mu transposase, C-terminal domain